MKILLAIIGIILLLPVAIVLVALICTTLIGGYIAAMLQMGWWVLLTILGVWAIVKLVKHFT